MIFDKHKLKKINDKKILHKIGKNWAIASVVVLDLVAAGGIKQIHADTTNQSQFNQKINSSLSAHQNQDNTTFNRYGQNNEAYDTSKNSFTNVDGFLTANSWYRPKMIHRDGKNWTASQQQDANDHHDFRPILMNWWPDKNTEVNYLNYMQKHGIINGTYHTSDSQTHLNQAAHNVQDNLEHNISSNHSYLINHMKPLFSNFIASQPQWNLKSEHYHKDALQGGYFKFKNSELTPASNTPYRYISRSGDLYNRTHNNHIQLEYLLGNDIDNSNPKVQAENLNFLYYLNNLGSILKNDSKANFDGIREDAVYSMDYDNTDILSSYLKDHYQPNTDAKADAHLNILEDGLAGSIEATNKNNNSTLTQDKGFLGTAHSALLNESRQRLGNLLNYNGINRSDDYSENNITPNYSRLSAHDGDNFDTVISIANDLKKKNPKISSIDAMNEGNHIFNEGNYQTTKINGQYYNVPSTYALLLTNKDTVPQIYYGDLYRTDKPYMAQPGPYYNAISTLLRARKKYVSGGQQMRQHGNNIISSVRFGKGALNPNSTGTDTNNTRTSGMGLVINNNPNLHPNQDISIYMGAAHRNQKYQPLMVTNGNGNNGNFNYNSHERLTTDNNGYLKIPKAYLRGFSNPQVSGNLSAWVPANAPANQDSSTAPSTSQSNDNNIYHSNAALDSHVLYESFSTFQPLNAPAKQKLDNVIAQPKSVKLMRQLGITDFRFPPHYMPVKHDISAPDAANQNGYAFEDRYNQGMNGQSTKYGTADQLLKANVALHNGGVHTLADYVANQLYDFPLQQAVSISRSDYLGNEFHNPNISNHLYNDNTMSSGKDFQNKYGGEFLSRLEQDSKYSNLFNTKQISTGQSIDPTTKIKQWSAKYENGSNLQGHGIDSILSNPLNNKQYYSLNNLPDSFVQAGSQRFPTTNHLNFVYKNKKIGSTSKVGYDTFNTKSLTLPKGYRLLNGNQNIKYDSSKHNIQVTPNLSTDTVSYKYNGKTVKQKTYIGNDWNVNGAANVAFRPKTADVPQGYHIIQPNNWIAYNGGEHDIPIWKNGKSLKQATSTVHYIYGNRDLGKEKFSGNAWSTGANEDAFQLQSQHLNVPKGYHVIQPNQWIANDGQNHNVAIWKNGEPLTQATDTLNYQNNQQWLGVQQKTGNAWSTGADKAAFQTNSQNLNPPEGYQIANPEQWIAFDGKDHTVNMTSQDKVTVDYMYNNHLVGSHSFTGSHWGTAGATNTAFQVGLTPNGLSKRYETANPNQWIAFDDNPHQINVLPKAKSKQLNSSDSQKQNKSQTQDMTTDIQSSALTAQEKKYLVNNQAYDNNSFTRQNGFLTADSWYRPKMIHQNGKRWVSSQSSDYRPIIMNWWPDQNTRNAYVNYMNEHLKQDGFMPQKNYDRTQLKSVYQNLNQIQDNLEKGTSKYGINWLRHLTDDFVASQTQWNRNSEHPANDNLQGGYMKFNNSSLTSNANSKYRDIGRSTTMQDRLQDNNQNAEFLLGNDIDNSNPKVLAEDLNHIYYLNNIGSITHGNHNLDDSGNFDGMREDATGSMNYDVTDILSQYMKDRNNMVNDQNADNHLNILEDAQQFKQNIRHNDALHQDEGMLFNLRSSLLYPTNQRNGGLNTLGGNDNGDLNFYHVNDTSDYNSDNANPNYSRVNLHDNDDFVKPITSMYKQTLASHPHMAPVQAVKQAVNAFNNGMYSTNKPLGEYYNLPSSYAYLLTNKDTVPQVYYGDLYRGDKPYMSTKTPYYDSITTLLKNRIKYVAGGQQMATHTAGNANYVSSVRFGKIMSGDFKGQQISTPDQYSKQNGFKPSTSGIATVIGNQPNAQPNGSITIDMGANHANQRYQPLLLSTQDGIDTQNSRNIQLSTNDQGQLVIPQEYLQGVSNPQVSGNLSVWAPIGAKDNQDIRTPASQDSHTDGNVYHQNPALDSHVLYESFSPFMPINAPKSQQLDSVIAGKVPKTNEDTSQWIKNLGLTDFRFPPHYSPVKHDNSFLDTIDQNGYSFEDRYDMNNTKYGNLTDMLQANGKLHQDGIHTLSDVVLNQVYDLPKSEIVSATRTDAFGDPVNSSQPHLYKDQSVSSSNDLQAKYGGRYLKTLKTLYPDLFNTKQIATNRRIDSSKSIKQWSAKYMNGSNLQNTGSGNVLKNQQNGQYYSNGKFPTIFRFTVKDNRNN